MIHLDDVKVGFNEQTEVMTVIFNFDTNESYAVSFKKGDSINRVIGKLLELTRNIARNEEHI